MKLKRLVMLVLALIVSISSVGIASPVVSASGTMTCQPISAHVYVSALDPTQYSLQASLCWQGALAGKTVQVLLHGLTYDHLYWDFPYEEPSYSYLAAAVASGYAVLNMDRLGAGQSDHPNDTEVSLTSGAYVTHQLVDDLRGGVFGGTAFSKIILVGHSAGSGIAILEASAHHDVDGLILSGYAHVLNPLAAPLLAAGFYPAILDPKFANDGYSAGYITTVPGVRAQLFYDTANADPNVIALDESLKQAGTAEELAQLPVALLPTVSLALTVPVFIADGQNDALLCSIVVPCTNSQTLLAREAGFFTPQACLEAYVLPHAGHDINLHNNAALWYGAANDWAGRRVGPNGVPTQPCQ